MPTADRLVKVVREGDHVARVFLDISTSGCGCDCSYCYVTDRGGEQVLASTADIEAAVARLTAMPGFRAGRDGTVISLCPNTEPFRTSQSTALVCLALEGVLRYGNLVQVATKEVVPTPALELLTHAAERGQVVVFVSLASPSRAPQIEPHAAPVDDRVSNFGACRAAGLTTCLYIKPFLPSAYADRHTYAAIVNDSEPDAVCAGVLYRRDESATPPNQHPVASAYATAGVGGRLREFASFLRAETTRPVFHTSVCVSAWAAGVEPRPPIWMTATSLCVHDACCRYGA